MSKARSGMPSDPYAAATSGVAVYDSSHCGRITFSGLDHLDFLHRMTTNAFTSRRPGEGFEAVFCDHRGRIVELGGFCRVDETETAAFVAPGRSAILLAWLEKYHFDERIEWVDTTGTTSQAELVGPRAAELASDALGVVLGEVEPLHLVCGGRPLVSRFDAGGHKGLRLWGSPDDVTAAVSRLVSGGAAALDHLTWENLRVEWGLPAQGLELTDDHNPWEAGLDRAIHLNKGCYLGQEVVARLDTYRKVKQRLVRLLLDAAALPGDLLWHDGQAVGHLTSVAESSSLGRPVALAYLRTALCQPGFRVKATTVGGEVGAEVRPLPLLPHRGS